MEETLGKRIAAHRKKLGLTQDALAEKLGVTAQAVSKWENDQSCPDITTLPKLAEIFDCTTDELLGIPARKQNTAEATHVEKSNSVASCSPEPTAESPITFTDFRSPGSIFALWLFLTGLISAIGAFQGAQYGLLQVGACCAVFTFGVLGFPGRFTFLRLGCILAGSAFLFNLIREPSIADIDWSIPIAIGFALLGLDLLIYQIRIKKGNVTSICSTVSNGNIVTHCTYDGESFDCSARFGEHRQLITMPRLSSGNAELSFGELVVDLSGCEEIADGCTLELNCSFGELELLVPRHCRVEPNISTAFASFDIKGSPAPDASSRIYVNGSTNFGDITFRYL